MRRRPDHCPDPPRCRADWKALSRRSLPLTRLCWNRTRPSRSGWLGSVDRLSTVTASASSEVTMTCSLPEDSRDTASPVGLVQHRPPRYRRRKSDDGSGHCHRYPARTTESDSRAATYRCSPSVDTGQRHWRRAFPVTPFDPVSGFTGKAQGTAGGVTSKDCHGMIESTGDVEVISTRRGRLQPPRQTSRRSTRRQRNWQQKKLTVPVVSSCGNG